ncbi:hypothetical protein [Aquitalea magnusonii]|uniref:Uncharacterized protein n=1 Tax=Aquitalea magnusonii TaxID=332411 RepID=A0A318J126_9NEIS|nr:hypothetical protein [Aquitalea magnusonii]PXX42224.1 hypothetical protein DFR38_12021 [Aquitalea magnusonii]
MATYNLDAPALAGAALVLEVSKAKAALRYERHYNVLAQAGLAVGDTVQFTLTVPEWVRTIVASKRTNTANADVLTVQCADPGLTLPEMLPIKTASSVQTGGSTSNAASNAVLMQLYPVGNSITVSLTLATSVPAQCELSIAFYDM